MDTVKPSHPPHIGIGGMYNMNNTKHIFIEVEAERKLQNLKWGEQNHNPSAWISILGEEYGEVCKTVNENKLMEYRKELIQMIAVGVAMVECVDKFNKGGVYLAGAIKGCKQKDIHEWRDHCVSMLNCKVSNPAMRDFSYPQCVDAMNDIVNPDKNMIDSCSILLANCWQISVGTSMEILYAWERNKLVITVVPEDSFVSAWITAHSHKIFNKLDDAINYINELVKGK